MHILFVHGMGRTPLSGVPILVRLRANGYTTGVFGYSAAFRCFDSIRDRLIRRVIQIASQGDYALVGHSLGGVLLRDALAKLPKEVIRPKHLFLLGSPIRSARLAVGMRNRILFRAMTGDCGQLLASNQRMQAIGPSNVETTIIIGTKGFNGDSGPFFGEINDGIVAASEAHADWVTDEVQVPVIHTLLPASYRVARILLNRLSIMA